MKKLLSVILVITMMFALAVAVNAGFEAEENNQNINYEFKGYAEKPAIDGSLDEFGYSKIDVAAGDISIAFNDSTDDGAAAARGLSFDLYASYDEDYVYFFISTDTKYYYNDMEEGSGDIWGQSAIQVNLSRVGDEGTDRLEFGIGRNSLDGVQQFFPWAQHPEAGSEIDLVAGTDYVVSLDGDRLNYECRVPVDTFMPAGTKLKAGDKFTFCLVMAQCDKENGEGGTGGYLHTQIASGCTGDPGKTAENFATVTLGAAIEKPAEPEPEPETEADVVTDLPEVDNNAQGGADVAIEGHSVPQTGDMTIFVVVALALSAGCFVFLRKKTTGK